MDEFIKSLPKAELHLHLEGTVDAATLVELSRRVDSEPLTLEQAEAVYVYDDFTGFINAFSTVTKKLVSPSEYELITRRMIEQLAAQGVVHAEVYVSIGELFRARKSTPETDDDEYVKTIDAIEIARLEGERKHGVTINWIIDSSRQEGVSEATRVFHTTEKFRDRYPSVVGIGLGGEVPWRNRVEVDAVRAGFGGERANQHDARGIHVHHLGGVGAPWPHAAARSLPIPSTAWSWTNCVSCPPPA